MSPKCLKISICVCFLIFSFGLLVLTGSFLCSRSFVTYFPHGSDRSLRNPTLTITRSAIVKLRDMSSDSEMGTLNTPSLEAYLRALPGEEGQELRLSGLGLYSELTNACQPLVDISKSKFQGNKIALVSLDEVLSPNCTLLGLATNAQDAGYSVLIFCVRSAPWHSDGNGMQTDPKDKLLIPVLYAAELEDLNFLDRHNVDISVQTGDDRLINMSLYLSSLHYWFLLGPVITLEWLRRRKRLCFMSGALQQGHEENAISGDERNVRVEVDEGGLRSEAQEPVANYEEETEHFQTGGYEQPLIVVINDPGTDLVTRMRQRTSIRVVVLFRKIFGKLAVGCGYVILIVAALPVGISSGGWSFFRFDENENFFTKSFWGDLPKFNVNNLSPKSFFWDNGIEENIVMLVYYFLPLWWSTLRIFCFFLYSRFACKNTWTVPSNSSKLIRSDWFASNMYLLIFGVVVPYCSFTLGDHYHFILFVYFATYNMVCTICNLLFIIILNKHKFLTRYVFYISVCMICAYIESDIVAVYYFMMNSEGSLTNLKLTALRTVAIGLTLTLSLSSSMHIIRKLTKPQESLFEGLAEK